MRPDQAELLREFLLPQLKSEQIVTGRILRAVPDNQSAYQPHPDSMSALHLSWHIVRAEIWFLDAVIHRQFGEFPPVAAHIQTAREVASWYDQNFAARMPRIATLLPVQLAAPVDYIGLRNDPAVAYLNIAIRHSVHHRGQLSAYLRPMGAKVPAIYVESGDEPYPPAVPSPSDPPPPAF